MSSAFLLQTVHLKKKHKQKHQIFRTIKENQFMSSNASLETKTVLESLKDFQGYYGGISSISFRSFYIKKMYIFHIFIGTSSKVSFQ